MTCTHRLAAAIVGMAWFFLGVWSAIAAGVLLGWVADLLVAWARG